MSTAPTVVGVSSERLLHDRIKELLVQHSPEQVIKAVRQVRDTAKNALAEELDKRQAEIDAARKKAGLPVRGARQTKAAEQS